MLETALMQYATHRTIEHRNVVVELALPLVKQVAKQTRNLYHPQMEFEDVVSDAMLCLVDCVERFDQNQGISFEAYTYARLKNNLIDRLRKCDFAPRRIRQTAKEVHRAQQELAHELMRQPSEEELSAYMGIDLETLHTHYREYAQAALTSLDAIVETGAEPSGMHMYQTPKTIYDEKLEVELLTQCLQRLTKREQLVLSLYYYESLTLKEIGQVLECTQARVCQIHAKAIEKLQRYMREEAQ